MSLTTAIKQPFVKIYNFVQREFAYTAQVDTAGDFIPFGPSNTFPNTLSSLVEGSPTATACLSTFTDFVCGEGFSEGKDLENLVINNQGLKFFRYHNIESDSLVHNWGVASLVKFNKIGQITEIYDIPFAYCRLGKPDSNGLISKIHYNPYFGTHLYQKKDTEVYETYNPAAAPVQVLQKGFKGQINWMGIRDKKHPFYPIPDYYSASHWMNVEKNASIYFDENLEDGFLQDSIMKIIGDPNDPSGLKDGEGNDIPKGKAFDEEMTKNFGNGAKTRHKLMAFWANNKDEFPEMLAFPSGANADLFRIQDEHATKKITIATKVPGILANISEGVSLGGDGNTVRAAVKLMQQRAVRPQDLLIDYYADMLKNFVRPFTGQIKIIKYSPFPELEVVDPQAWGVLTQEEKRKWVKDQTQIELIEEEVPGLEPEPVTPVQNRVVALHFDSYPKQARENVKRALEWYAKMNTGCLKPRGMEFSEKIMNGVPLGPKDIKRLSGFLSKRTMVKDHTWDNCETLEYHAWGGSEMMVWANEKVKELNGKID